MPTPTNSFLDVADRYGNVDPNDPEAVHEWYTKVLPTLPAETIEEILEILLEGEGTSAEGESTRSYPKDVPLPSLAASPSARIPLLAAGWREFVRQLIRRRQGARESGGPT